MYVVEPVVSPLRRFPSVCRRMGWMCCRVACQRGPVPNWSHLGTHENTIYVQYSMYVPLWEEQPEKTAHTHLFLLSTYTIESLRCV